MSYFSNIKDYVNSKQIGDFVTRKELLQIACNASSVDPYRRCLVLCGFIEGTEKLGVYKKIKNIPDSLTSNKLTRNAYKNIRYSLKYKYL